jgi:hypothetical protein
MQSLSRREFAQQTLGSVLTLSLLETLFQCDAFADDEVIHQYHRAARELWKFCWIPGGATQPLAWQLQP